jgi:hypothetical protein
MSKTKMLAAKELIDEKRYDEARTILRSVDHPKAVEWLEKLDKIDPPNALQKIFRAVLPKASIPSKPVEQRSHPLASTLVQESIKQAAPIELEAELEAQEDSEDDQEPLINPTHKKRNSYHQAVAGEFDGIEFKSQLEIRFAAELKKRNIEYEYESARIGKGQYMVDFYLPKHRIWVEVKGKMDARDEYLLQECAELLKKRDEALYVYFNDRKMHLVQGDKLEYLWPGKFWEMLEVQQSEQ